MIQPEVFSKKKFFTLYGRRYKVHISYGDLWVIIRLGISGECIQRSFVFPKEKRPKIFPIDGFLTKQVLISSLGLDHRYAEYGNCIFFNRSNQTYLTQFDLKNQNRLNLVRKLPEAEIYVSFDAEQNFVGFIPIDGAVFRFKDQNLYPAELK